ncbi:hypothetical protein AWENTII_005456 [Aspergillus wentii]|nr:hypothetical protein MW887_000616 [Aspergillus wentii]
MAAVDVHRLRKRYGFDGQNIFFYYNHPIRFVQLAGIIVARTEVPRRTVLTLDDSSGATVDIVVLKKEDAPVSVSTGSGRVCEDDETPSSAAAKQTQPKTEMHLASTTKTDLDISTLHPGTVIKVKGTLSTFRSAMQLQLERFFAVPDTNAEMQFLDQRIRFLVDVLSTPWYLSDEEIDQLRLAAEEEEERVEGERERALKRQRRRAEREEKDQRRIQRMWEAEERKREKEASSVKDAGLRVMRDIEMRKRAREM